MDLLTSGVMSLKGRIDTITSSNSVGIGFSFS